MEYKIKSFIFAIINIFFLMAPVNAQNIKNNTKIHYSSKLEQIKEEQLKRRRITNVEKELLTSKDAQKRRILDRTIVQRKIFECSPDNIKLMLRGRAPIGTDDKKVNLHHLKQQQEGALVELTETEHNYHSKVLHRYVRNGSEIADRNNGFQSFRQQYWKSRALDCKVRGS